MYLINVFAQIVVSEPYTHSRRISTPYCLRSLRNFRVASYQNWAVSTKQGAGWNQSWSGHFELEIVAYAVQPEA
jgi:hypothetical protein